MDTPDQTSREVPDHYRPLLELIEGQQRQIDDLVRTVTAQQTTIDDLQRTLNATGSGSTGASDGAATARH